MFCSNCGNQLGDQDKFCAKCGTSVRGQIQQPVNTSEIMPVQQEEKTPVKKKSVWLILSLSVAAVIVLIILFVCVSVSEKRAGNTFKKYRSEYEMDRGYEHHNEGREFQWDSSF